MFKPLSTAYSNELSAFMNNSQGLASIAKRDFFGLFWNAWVNTMRQPLVLRAFKATGISPLNPTTILRRFDQPQLPEPPSRESSKSILSASDWRKIDRLLKDALENVLQTRRSRSVGLEECKISMLYRLLKMLAVCCSSPSLFTSRIAP
ncbi:transposase [Paraphaeosphaeria minitans]|uniref:Transposase n=1 Tax=Paraphaeosphaeria minitans TaxID=565426 RepID=A0A9P6KKK8_9PLEO|nr:transposase [Paraphaeosphaeria minitans]